MLGRSAYFIFRRRHWQTEQIGKVWNFVMIQHVSGSCLASSGRACLAYTQRRIWHMYDSIYNVYTIRTEMFDCTLNMQNARYAKIRILCVTCRAQTHDISMQSSSPSSSHPPLRVLDTMPHVLGHAGYSCPDPSLDRQTIKCIAMNLTWHASIPVACPQTFGRNCTLTGTRSRGFYSLFHALVWRARSGSVLCALPWRLFCSCLFRLWDSGYRTLSPITKQARVSPRDFLLASGMWKAECV